ncbi:MAG: TetR/AcrR family transcriptional regulator [Oligoflexus sp.]
MRKTTKDKILDSAHRLFNKYGVAKVSLRQIAEEVGISHSNLTYHLSSKEEIIAALHDRLLNSALMLNEKLNQESFHLDALYRSTILGFGVLYDYRFFVKELPTILKADRILHEKFLDVEKVRANMYLELIHQAIDCGLMRSESYPGEHLNLIKRIRIFSDNWLPSSEIYDKGTKEGIIIQNAKLLMDFFYPYLTKAGQKQFSDLCIL